MTKSKKNTTNNKITEVNSIQQELRIINEAYTSGAFKYLRILIHIVGVTQFTYATYYQLFKLKPNNVTSDMIKAEWAGPFKFLTFLDVILQAVYFIVALVNDIFGSNDIVQSSTSKIRKLRDYIFVSWAFPIAHNVAILFWIIYAYDRELIFPTALDAFFPSWLNHIVHTNVALMCVLDLFTCFRIYPKRIVGTFGTFAFIFTYIVWIHVVYQHTGYWVYPILSIINAPLRYLLLSGLILFTIACYALGESLNKVIWSKESQLIKRRLKQK